MRLSVVGVDISKEWFDFSIEGESSTERVPNDDAGCKALLKKLRKLKIGKARLCMEATGMYFELLAASMHKQGHEVVVVNPQCIKAFSNSELRRTKTDPLDAQLIARFCAEKYETLILWEPPSVELRTLKDMLRRRSQLVEMRSAEKCRISAGYPTDPVTASIKLNIDWLDKQVEEMERQIEAHIGSHAEIKRQVELLDSIAGINKLTAATLLAEIPEPLRVGRLAAAYAGLAPTENSSGKRQGKGYMSRVGSSRIRGALYMPAVSVINSSNTFGEFYRRLVARGLKPKQALVAVSRKMLHVAFAILKSGVEYKHDYQPTIRERA